MRSLQGLTGDTEMAANALCTFSFRNYNLKPVFRYPAPTSMLFFFKGKGEKNWRQSGDISLFLQLKVFLVNTEKKKRFNVP